MSYQILLEKLRMMLHKEQLMADSKKIDEQVQVLKSSLELIEVSLNNHLLEIPNLPHHSCPVGHNDKDNKIIEKIFRY